MNSLASHLLAFCNWANGSFFGHGIRDSVWLFPFVEIFHLLALSILGGTLIVLNLRLLGIRFPATPLPDLARELEPWLLWSLVVMLVSGFLLFSTEAVKMYGNWAFQLKMLLLIVSAAFTFSVYRRVIRADEARFTRTQRSATALASFVLWIGVALAGRALGYVPTNLPSVTGPGAAAPAAHVLGASGSNQADVVGRRPA